MCIKTNKGKVVCLASIEVLIYEYKCFEDDSMFNRSQYPIGPHSPIFSGIGHFFGV